MQEIKEIKKRIYQIAAITDRGQRLNRLIAPLYQEKLKEMELLINDLEKFTSEITKDKLSGEWELIYSTVELFRSSPFFLAIEKALNDEIKSNLFFKLHQLQVGSFGLSTIGRILNHPRIGIVVRPKIIVSKVEINSFFSKSIF